MPPLLAALLCLLLICACTRPLASSATRDAQREPANDLVVEDWDRVPLEAFMPPGARFAGVVRENLRAAQLPTRSAFVDYLLRRPDAAPSASSAPPGRALQSKGSNCIVIERGKVPRYYDCNGCVIDRAQGCIDDLRHNRSLNVHSACAMAAASVRYLGDCCPRVRLLNGRYDLEYRTAGYAMALRCLADVGCGDSVARNQLATECEATCAALDPRTGLSVCYADFNAAAPPLRRAGGALGGALGSLLLSGAAALLLLSL